ncbi:MAG: helix-turn-helix domain-containing protein [Oscillospiraceae bacterium]|nr:helix-turn-helix domain-containing protein [Oscillospiraceae bacterium]
MTYDIKQSGERIRQLRKQNGYTQEALAGELNMDRSVLSRIEVGKYACSIDSLAQISIFFGVSLDYLVFGKVQDDDTERLREYVTDLIQHLEHFKESL